MHSVDFLSAKHLALHAVYRQAEDPVFAEFLNYVRTRRPTAEYIQQVLGACMRIHEELETLLTPYTTILCSHR
jgi:hypothetical protein